MVSSRDLEVRLRADISGLQSQLAAANAALDRLGGTTQATGASFTALSGAVALGEAAFNAALGVVDRFRDSIIGTIAAASEAEDAQARLTAVTQVHGDTTGAISNELSRYATELQHLTGIDDETVKGAESIIFALTGQKTATEQGTLAAANLAALMKSDLSSSARLLAVALEDPVAGLTRLQRQIGTVDQATKDHIKALVDAGNAEQARAVVIDLVNSKVGGLAETMGSTASGQLARFHSAINDLQELMGGAVLKAFDDDLKRLADWAQSDAAVEMTKKFADEIGRLATEMGNVLEVMGKIASSGPIRVSLEVALGVLGGAAPKTYERGTFEGSFGAGVFLVNPAGQQAQQARNRALDAQAQLEAETGGAASIPLFNGFPYGTEPVGQGINTPGPDYKVPTAAAQAEARNRLQAAYDNALANEQFGVATPPKTGGGGRTATAFSAANLGLIDQIVSGVPSSFAPNAIDASALAEYDRQAAQFADIRKGVNRDLAELGLKMADLDARGQELSPEFMSLQERSDALKDALKRVDLEQTTNGLDAFSGVMEQFRQTAAETARATQAAIEAEKKLAEERNKAAVQLFGQTLGASPNFKGFASEQVAQEFIDNLNKAVGGGTIAGGTPKISLSDDLMRGDGVQ